MKTLFNGVVISAKLVAQGVKFPFDNHKESSHNLYHDQFKIKLQKDGKSTSFNWYDSHANWANGVIELDEKALINAVDNFLSDGIGSADGFNNFCGEFGYDEDSRTAERIYNACCKHLTKALHLFDDLDSIYKFQELTREAE